MIIDSLNLQVVEKFEGMRRFDARIAVRKALQVR